MRRGRENLFEELGRVEGERSNKNRRAEVSRIHGELNKGYAEGGPTGKQSLRDKLKRIKEPKWGRKGFYERAGGSEKAKPHSTKEGRTAAGKRRVGRILADAHKPRGDKKDAPWEKKRPERIMTPYRAKKGVGGILKKIISKIKPKPKEVNVDKLLKNLGNEIKAAPLPPQLKKSLDKLKKAYPSKSPHARNKESKKMFKTVQGKAAGGRIGLSHGGSAGAAIRGRGAEIK